MGGLRCDLRLDDPAQADDGSFCKVNSVDERCFESFEQILAADEALVLPKRDIPARMLDTRCFTINLCSLSCCEGEAYNFATRHPASDRLPEV